MWVLENKKDQIYDLPMSYGVNDSNVAQVGALHWVYVDPRQKHLSPMYACLLGFPWIILIARTQRNLAVL